MLNDINRKIYVYKSVSTLLKCLRVTEIKKQTTKDVGNRGTSRGMKRQWREGEH
jgi:hypothetical protein